MAALITLYLTPFLCWLLSTLCYFAALQSVRTLTAVVGNFGTIVISLGLGMHGSVIAQSAGVSIDSSLSAGIAMAVGQILAGVAASIPLIVSIEMLLMSARIADTSSGAQFAEQVAPVLGERVSNLENAMTVGAIVLVCATGSLLHWLELVDSFSQQMFSISLSVLNAGIDEAMIFSIVSMATQGIKLSLLIAAPVILLCLVLDVAAAIAGRMLRRVNLGNEFQSVKLVLTAGVFLYSCFWRLGPDTMLFEY